MCVYVPVCALCEVCVCVCTVRGVCLCVHCARCVSVCALCEVCVCVCTVRGVWDTAQLLHLPQLLSPMSNLRLAGEGQSVLSFGSERVSTKSSRVSVPTAALRAAVAQPGQW